MAGCSERPSFVVIRIEDPHPPLGVHSLYQISSIPGDVNGSQRFILHVIRMPPLASLARTGRCASMFELPGHTSAEIGLWSRLLRLAHSALAGDVGRIE